jgi:hypothetical protein
MLHKITGTGNRSLNASFKSINKVTTQKKDTIISRKENLEEESEG